MSHTPTLYIAGLGMITPVGANSAMTAASVNAGISGYAQSNYYAKNGELITMAAVPNQVFTDIDATLDEGRRYAHCHDRILKMAIIALRQACAQHTTQHSVPLVLAMPEPEGQIDIGGLVSLIHTLEQNCAPWVTSPQTRTIHSGRAAGMEAIEFAFRYLYDLPDDFILIGASDSHQDNTRLEPLINADRLLAPGNIDGFAPGEAACFLLLTRHPALAMERNGQIIALTPPGIAKEPGHLGSEAPYRGDGLDQAIKHALINHQQPNIHTIYSSMNGEHHWAKEYGVALMRNKKSFIDKVKTEHPADIFGDLGAATAPTLIALAAEALFKNKNAHAHLVYSSSDSATRGAIVVEKVTIAAENII